jgi:ABC-type branched-subunit amino acid transport system ATPase component
MADPTAIIETRELTRRYGDTLAVDRLTLTVRHDSHPPLMTAL